MRACWIAAACVLAGAGAVSANSYLEFDGGDRVVVENPVGLDPDQITVECLVNFGRIAWGDGYSSTDNQWIACKGSECADGAYRLSQGGYAEDDPTLVWAVDQPYQSHRVKVRYPLEPDRWYHLAGTYDGTTLKLFVDGELADEEDIGPVTVGNDESLYLGHSSLTGWEYFLTGGLDEVRIWDYARQQAEIQADMGAALTGDEPGLIGYWNFEEEPSSQWALDATAFQSHGRLGTSEGPDSADPTRVPEPALLSILAAGAFVLTRRRRR